MGRDVMRWDEMRNDEMRWNETRQDAMENQYNIKSVDIIGDEMIWHSEKSCRDDAKPSPEGGRGKDGEGVKWNSTRMGYFSPVSYRQASWFHGQVSTAKTSLGPSCIFDLLTVHMAVCQNLVPLVNIKIAGKWMFIPLKMVLIGIDPYPYLCKCTHGPLYAVLLEVVSPTIPAGGPMCRAAAQEIVEVHHCMDGIIHGREVKSRWHLLGTWP
jgi:hypothetical protein